MQAQPAALGPASKKRHKNTSLTKKVNVLAFSCPPLPSHNIDIHLKTHTHTHARTCTPCTPCRIPASVMVAICAVDLRPELKSEPRPVISAIQSDISRPDRRSRAAVSGSSRSICMQCVLVFLFYDGSCLTSHKQHTARSFSKACPVHGVYVHTP